MSFNLDAFVKKPDAVSEPQLGLLYGPPGGGKSWLAASAAEVDGLWPVLVIDVEGSTQGTLTGLPADRIDIIRPQEQENVPVEKRYEFVMWTLNELLTKEHKYKTVIIDTADVLLEMALEHHHNPADGFAKWNKVHSDLTSIPSAENFGLFHSMKEADFFGILVVHEKKNSDAEGAGLASSFMWQGQGAAKLGGIPDFVGYVSRDTNAAGKSVSTLMTGPTSRSEAKSRFSFAWPAKIVDPSMKKLYDLIREHGKDDNNNKKENK